MKKIKLNPRALLKSAVAITFVAAYWYWVNQRIISDTGQAYGLVGYFALMSLATAYFPLPANIIVLGAVKTADAWLVALLGGLATLISYLSEYVVFTLLFKFNRIANFKNSWIYQKVSPLFNRYKFFMLAFTSFLPIPAEALRIYAITKKYSPALFMLSGFVGRVPRYFLLGYYGKEYVNSVWFLVVVFLFPGLLLLLIKAGYGIANSLRARLAPKPVE